MLTQPHKDELRDYLIYLKGKAGGKEGYGKEKGSLRENITSILKDLTDEENAEKYGKEEMVSELQSLIVDYMPGNGIPSVPPSKNMKESIGRSE